MKNPSQSVLFKKTDLLFKQGEKVKGLFLIEEGIVKVTQKDRKGKIIFARLAFPQDTVGHRSIFIHDSYKGTAEVVTESARVSFFTSEKISEILRTNPEFAKKLISKIAWELQKSEDELIQKKEQSAYSRISKFLYEVSLKYSEKTSVGSLKLKSILHKKDIAQALMLADETVIRNMTELKKEKIIAYEDKRILILNPQKLKASGSSSFFQ